LSNGYRLVMVFHCPFAVGSGRLLSANMARPVRMLEGFRAAGYRVLQITGSARKRRRSFARLKGLVAQGEAIDFVYSETSNLPLFFNESDRLPVHPFLEYRLFRWLRKKGIPTGLFLRDLHWRFPHFRHYPLYKRLPALLFYRLDWLLYMSRCDRLFLPTAGLAAHLPTKSRRLRIAVLPPGCQGKDDLPRAEVLEPRTSRQGLSLFYVGGVTPPLYNLAPVFACAEKLPSENVVVCCRSEEWLKARSLYAHGLSSNVRIVHAQGTELAGYYRSADLFIFTLEPYEYMKLALPYKIFEAVSYRLPILTFAGSETARWVEEEDAGWVVQDLTELIDLVGRLRESPELLREKARKLGALAEKHSWKNRALAVARELSAPSAQLFGAG
jgi:glycosyltransferase involved in cell wall biosynthesis